MTRHLEAARLYGGWGGVAMGRERAFLFDFLEKLKNARY